MDAEMSALLAEAEVRSHTHTHTHTHTSAPRHGPVPHRSFVSPLGWLCVRAPVLARERRGGEVPRQWSLSVCVLPS